MIRNIQNGKEFSREQNEINAKLKVLLEKRLPEKAEVLLEKSIHDSFDKETYQDGKSSKWDTRKKEPKQYRKILIGEQGGTLHRSIEVRREGEDIIAGTDVEYAQRHNEGLAKMPQRQFMPAPGENNPQLEKDIEKFLDSELDKLFG